MLMLSLARLQHRFLFIDYSSSSSDARNLGDGVVSKGDRLLTIFIDILTTKTDSERHVEVQAKLIVSFVCSETTSSSTPVNCLFEMLISRGVSPLCWTIALA